MIAYYLEYTQRGAYGSGGWSRNAKHKPQPVVRRYDGPVVMEGKSVWLGADKSAIRKAKVTLFDDSQIPPRLIRADYNGAELRMLGAELPPLFIGFNEAICDATGRIVFEGPRAGEQ